MAEKKACKKEKGLEPAGRGKIRFSFLNEKGFGMNEILGIAATLIIAAFVIIPGLKGFAELLMEKMDGWWKEITDQIFLK